MNDLFRQIAALPQVNGVLTVKPLDGSGTGSLCLTRTDSISEPVVAIVHWYGGEAVGYARLLSGAPAMLDLLAGLLLQWGEAVEDDSEINGGDAVEWLSQFTMDAREVLLAMVRPLTPEAAS